MNILKAVGSFGSLTLLSRVLGYFRDILIAIFIGTSSLADAFFVAFRLPNTFRRLFAEGTFNAAFIPIYTKLSMKNRSENFTHSVFNFLLIILFAIDFIIPCVIAPAADNPKITSAPLTASSRVLHSVAMACLDFH